MQINHSFYGLWQEINRYKFECALNLCTLMATKTTQTTATYLYRLKHNATSEEKHKN